ncbi:MAG: hypothetical protein PHP54_05835 [Clostridia bacterium]|nr:hypothetical protein [Clostridia bacterium]
MNTLFIDISNPVSKDKGKKKFSLNNITYKAKKNILQYEMIEDYLKHGNVTNNFSLKISKEELNKLINNKKKIKKLYFEKDLKNKVKKVDKLNIVFSKYFDENSHTKYKEYIVNTLKKKRENFEIKEIVAENKMKEHVIKYIDDYVENFNISLNKLRILLILNDSKDFSKEKITEYILKYKFVDVLKMNGISKLEYQKLSSMINELNEEFGSTIDIIQKRNIQEYHIYLMCSRVVKNDFYSHYIVKKDSKYIDLNNEDEDIDNNNMKQYNKCKYELATLFNRLELVDDNFSKNKLGALSLEDMN